ncbi:hypothetical protein G8E10_15340 [Rhizobiaceae bacterium CRRU44]|uniref:Uncharacterized protein n=1 Tax=Ferranicluibacter rubi TaxID=2715133 RepID=A0AA44CBD9_9HYPH|nr:hypothetical protein [Ferranicluibacter rubi]NHT77090.1 hypothetical protein [Ferranicluibacter rubi]
MKRTAIIGNAPEFDGTDLDLDGYDRVVRFNNTAGLGSTSGTKTSELVLVSRGGQPAEWLADPAFTQRKAVRDAERVTLVFPPSEKPEDECHAEGLREHLGPLGKDIGSIDAATESRARASLLAHGALSTSALSSGFLYSFRTLEAEDSRSSSFDIFGFGFDGWDGHAWSAERSWFEAAHKAGWLVLHPLAKR